MNARVRGVSSGLDGADRQIIGGFRSLGERSEWMQLRVIGETAAGLASLAADARAETAAPSVVFSSKSGFLKCPIADDEGGLDAPANTTNAVYGGIAGPLDASPISNGTKHDQVGVRTDATAQYTND